MRPALHLGTQHPQEPQGRGEHGKRQDPSQRLHPFARARQELGKPRRRSKQQVRRRQPQSDGKEDGVDTVDRLRQRDTHRAAQHRRAAGSGQGHGQQPLQEFSHPQGMVLRQRHPRHPEFEETQKIDGKDRHQGCQEGHVTRLLELRPPSGRQAGGLERHHGACQQQQSRQDSGRRGQSRQARHLGLFRRKARERKRLERQHRKHAGHQVEDQSSDQPQEQSDPEPRTAARRPDRRSRSPARLQRVLPTQTADSSGRQEADGVGKRVGKRGRSHAQPERVPAGSGSQRLSCPPLGRRSHVEFPLPALGAREAYPQLCGRARTGKACHGVQPSDLGKPPQQCAQSDSVHRLGREH